MSSIYIKINDPPPTRGGEYESEVRHSLVKELSEKFLIIGGASFSTKASFFYEYDVLVLSLFLCEVIEVKRIYPLVKVFEDELRGFDDFHVPMVFSILENKAKVLGSKLGLEPFEWRDAPRVSSRVVIGPETTNIEFDHEGHKINKKVLKLSEIIKYYKQKERDFKWSKNETEKWRHIQQIWKKYSETLRDNPRSVDKIGRFSIIKRVNENPPEYIACDEPPCKVTVLLKEFIYEPIMRKKDLEKYLKVTAREMQVLRNIRHPNVLCVVGHFRTGSSLVQVSDWFDGNPLEDCWQAIGSLSMEEKIEIMIKVTRGLLFCHSKGVFHRHICASNIIADSRFTDVKISGFEYAKEIELTETLIGEQLDKRKKMLFTPEELLKRREVNYRLSDIFQMGILFYRLMENGRWPYEDSYDYAIKKCSINKLENHHNEKGFSEIKELIYDMLDIYPERRPDPMSKIEGKLESIMGASFRPI